MNEGRLEALHVRNLSRVKARQKPFKLPVFFEKLLQDRDLERFGEDEEKAAADTNHAEKERAIASMTLDQSRQEGSESQLEDLRASQRVEFAGESNAL